MLHHVPSPALQDRLLAEVCRVLKPGGVFVGADSVDSPGFQLIHLRDTMVVIDPDTFGTRLRGRGDSISGGLRRLQMPIIRREILPYLAWVIALVGAAGSLFFSEVMQLPPCVLCWYQRIALYPLVIIIGCGIVMRDSRMRNYALPFCLIGLAVSIYHNLVYYRIIPEGLAPCAQGIPCTSRQIEWLGFVTIPLMSLAAFVGLALCLLFYKSEREGE